MNLRHIHQYELGIDIFILVVKFVTCANLILTDPIEEKSLIDIVKKPFLVFIFSKGAKLSLRVVKAHSFIN